MLFYIHDYCTWQQKVSTFLPSNKKTQTLNQHSPQTNNIEITKNTLQNKTPLKKKKKI